MNAVQPFSLLSEELNLLLSGHNSTKFSQKDFTDILRKAEAENPWFTKEYIRFALEQTATALRKENLEKWLSAYHDTNSINPKTIGVIMAGNIPLVGFHDMLSVLITNHNLIAKLSSKDKVLPEFIRQMIIAIQPEFENKIRLTDEQISGFDAIIATGSNNSAQVFKQYFGKYPHIIRKNRNSVAILTGQETEAELKGLARDIFVYFGLGCRNVSKIYIPRNYPVESLFGYFDDFKHFSFHNKYMNNYDYQKAVLLMNSEKFLDGNFFLMQENTAIASPIGVIYYEYYDNLETLKAKLALISHELQVVVSSENKNFGLTQSPELWDYADGVDTLKFLLNL